MLAYAGNNTNLTPINVMGQIKMYSESELRKARAVKSEQEMRMAMSNGSDSDPVYTISQFVSMLEAGTWSGGHVAFIGYIPANMFIEEESGEFDISIFKPRSGFDFDSFWGSFYSQLNSNLYNDISNLINPNGTDEMNNAGFSDSAILEEVQNLFTLQQISQTTHYNTVPVRCDIIIKTTITRYELSVKVIVDEGRPVDGFYSHTSVALYVHLKSFNYNNSRKLVGIIPSNHTFLQKIECEAGFNIHIDEQYELTLELEYDNVQDEIQIDLF